MKSAWRRALDRAANTPKNSNSRIARRKGYGRFIKVCTVAHAYRAIICPRTYTGTCKHLCARATHTLAASKIDKVECARLDDFLSLDRLFLHEDLQGEDLVRSRRLLVAQRLRGPPLCVCVCVCVYLCTYI